MRDIKRTVWILSTLNFICGAIIGKDIYNAFIETNSYFLIFLILFFVVSAMTSGVFFGAYTEKLVSSYFSKKIHSPPGMYVLRVVGFLYPKKVKDRIFSPILADMHSEYFDALDNGLKWKARWIHCLGVLSVISKGIGLLPMSVLDVIVTSIKIE